MLFQQATPDTSGYMIAGYVVAFLVMGLYAASMYLRSRNLKQDISTLEEIDKPESAPAQRHSMPKMTDAQPTKTVTKTSTQK